jgi:hypothetical protein
MRYATALVAALALGAAASLYTPKADAGVVIGVGLPVPVVAPPVAYYPYGPAPVVGFGVGFGPAFYGRGFYGPAFRGPAFYRPGYLRGGFGYVHGGYVHGGYGHGGYGFRR